MDPDRRPCSHAGCTYRRRDGSKFCSRHDAVTRLAMARDRYLAFVPYTRHEGDGRELAIEDRAVLVGPMGSLRPSAKDER